MKTIRGFISTSILFWLLSLEVQAQPHPLESWQWINPTPCSFDLSTILYDGQRFIATGRDYGVLLSEDGEHWRTGSYIPQTAILSGVIEIPMLAGTFGKYLAIDNFAQAYSSTDAVHWVVTAAPSSEPTTALRYAKDHFMRGTLKGLYVLNDEAQWIRTTVPSATSMDTDGVTIAALTSDRKLFVSETGLSWKEATPSIPDWKQVIWLSHVDGLWFAAGNFGVLFTSQNGIDWNLVMPSDVHKPGFSKNSAIRLKNQYWIRQSTVWLRSADGILWENGPTRVVSASVSGLVSNGEKVLEFGSSGYIGVTEDLENWKSLKTLQKWTPPYHLFHENGTLISIGQDGLAYSYSTNSADWLTLRFPVTKPIVAIAYGQGRFVAVGDGGTILVSQDLESWDTVDPLLPNNLHGIFYHDGHFVIPTEQSTILHSTNGLDWTQIKAPASESPFWCANWFRGQFYFGNGKGEMYETADFIEWTHQTLPPPSPTTTAITFLASGDDRLLAVQYGKAWTTQDGVHWTSAVVPLLSSPSGCGFGGGFFVILTPTGTVRYSEDGLDWTRIKITQEGGSALAFGADRFWFGTTVGSLLRCGPLMHLKVLDSTKNVLTLHGDKGTSYSIESRDGLDPKARWESEKAVMLESNPQQIPVSGALGRAVRLYRARMDP